MVTPFFSALRKHEEDGEEEDGGEEDGGEEDNGGENNNKKNKERGGKEPEWQVTCIFYSQVSSNTIVSSVYTDNNPGEYSSDYNMTVTFPRLILYIWSGFTNQLACLVIFSLPFFGNRNLLFHHVEISLTCIFTGFKSAE